MSNELSQVLQEVNRVHALGVEYAYGRLDDRGLARALDEQPLPPAPGWLQRLIGRLEARRLERSWGALWILRRNWAFHSGPSGFACALLADGRRACTFDLSAVREAHPILLHWAARRVFAANGWSYREHLHQREPFSALFELTWAQPLDFRPHHDWPLPPAKWRRTPEGEVAELEVTGRLDSGGEGIFTLRVREDRLEAAWSDLR